MVAYSTYLTELCDGCQQPKAHAWHPDNDGFYDTHSVICHGCTARTADDDGKTTPVHYTGVTFTRDLNARPYPTDDELAQLYPDHPAL